MANVREVLEKMQEIRWKLDSLISFSGYRDYSDLSGLEMDERDADQLFLRDELEKMLEKIEDVHYRLTYLARPIRETSQLHKNKYGRYETENGHEYTSGDGIEILVTDDCHDESYWAWTNVEHNGQNYYLTGHRDVRMDGLLVRVREGY